MGYIFFYRKEDFSFLRGHTKEDGFELVGVGWARRHGDGISWALAQLTFSVGQEEMRNNFSRYQPIVYGRMDQGPE